MTELVMEQMSFFAQIVISVATIVLAVDTEG